MYLANEMKCRKFSTFFFYYGCGHVSTFTTAIIRATFDICTGNFDTSAWNLAFNLVLPIGTQNLSGWLLNWLFQFNMSIVYALCTILTTSHFSCFCYYIIATCNHFVLIIGELRFKCEQIQKEKTIQKRAKLRQNATQTLQQAIELHSQIYE